MENIAILGSTGSIGTSTLEVESLNLDKFSISLLASDSNYKLLIKQCKKFNPKYVYLRDDNAAKLFKDKLSFLNLRTSIVN